MRKKLEKWLFLLAYNLFAALAIFEVLLVLTYSSPSVVAYAPSNLATMLRNHHQAHVAPIIHFQPHCGRYDPKLIYRLAPGSCHFRSAEFDTVVNVNQLGLRGASVARDEEPAVLSLGDSYALGWGVSQNETYSSILEKKIKRSVANLGQASYGTVRELQFASVLGFTKPQYVVLQVSHNDGRENQQFLSNNFKLPIRSEESFKEIVDQYRKSRIYIPGRYVISFLLDLFSNSDPGPSWVPTAKQVIDVAEPLLEGFSPDTRLLVIYIAEPGGNDEDFLAEYRSLQAASRSSLVRESESIPLGNLDRYRFLLDIHLRPEGHQYLAEKIAQTIRNFEAKAGQSS